MADRETHPSLAELREEYSLGGLAEEDASDDPLDMLRSWLREAIDAGLYDPTAMVLSTVEESGGPTSRMVLCKGIEGRGLVFFTNYDSAKGRALAAEQHCSLLFPWHPLQRQVRVSGTASRLADSENDEYFASRPRGSQLGAVASPQSQPIASREELDRLYAEAESRFEGREVERPDHWGGYRVEPTSVEFWQGRLGRLHDRLLYTRDVDGWMRQRLAP